jgi:hypothetical protein
MNRELHPFPKSDIHMSNRLSEDSVATLKYDRTEAVASR